VYLNFVDNLLTDEMAVSEEKTLYKEIVIISFVKRVGCNYVERIKRQVIVRHFKRIITYLLFIFLEGLGETFNGTIRIIKFSVADNFFVVDLRMYSSLKIFSHRLFYFYNLNEYVFLKASVTIIVYNICICIYAVQFSL
jgi:hypothetical protein